jgi:hypothetical protein
MATEVIYRESRRRYQWPEVQLNLWILIILSASATVLGIFAWFITVQNQLQIGTPWYVAMRLSPFSAKHLLTCPMQAVPFCDRDRKPLAPLPPRHPHSCRPADAHPWRHHPRRLHTLRAMAHNTHRDRGTTVWVGCKRQRQLQPIRVRSAVHRHEPGHVGIPDADKHLQLLESGFCVRDRGGGSVCVDRDSGIPGAE